MIRTWDRSRALYERACNSLTGGVSSPVRAKAPVPLYFTNGHGARLIDVDGNEYIDYQLAWGPNVLAITIRAWWRRCACKLSGPTAMARSMNSKLPWRSAFRPAFPAPNAWPSLPAARSRAACPAPGAGTYPALDDPEVQGPLPRLDRFRTAQPPPRTRGKRDPRERPNWFGNPLGSVRSVEMSLWRRGTMWIFWSGFWRTHR